MKRKQGIPAVVRPSFMLVISSLVCLLRGLAFAAYIGHDAVTRQKETLVRVLQFGSVISAGMFWIGATHRFWFTHLWHPRRRTSRLLHPREMKK